MKAIRYISAILFCLVCTLAPTASRAQIGYQVSLLNTATGEPRAGVTVSAAVTITDSSDKVVYTGTQQATTNDFGVLSLAVGDDATFKNADWSKLPFFISVTVDGTLVGKSQILSVPVAEYAKKTGELTKEMLVGTWVNKSTFYSIVETTDCNYKEYSKSDAQFLFSEDGKFTYKVYLKWWSVGRCNGGDWSDDYMYELSGEYFINGNDVRLIYDSNDSYEYENEHYTEYSTNFFINVSDRYYV
ncbi:MAG: hypothetical protein K2L56_01900, partial [Prevotella sp.]|nr:hypothetical protein [Prevotella sp.]